MQRQSLSVPGKLTSLDRVAEYVESTAHRAGLNNEKTYNLRLAIDEIVTNIILYGYEQAKLEGTVELQTEISAEGLTMVVEDSAAAYNPADTPPPDLTSPFEERPMGGLGVFFAITGVDKFYYERVDNRNRNTFIIFKR